MSARLDTPEAVAKRFRVSRESLERLARHVDLLRKWQARINLVAPSTLNDIWTRHVADSLQLLSLLPEEASPLLDLGSGAGFPGLVLAIATPRPVHLVESNAKKAAFLREAIRATGAAAMLHHGLIQEFVLTPPPGVITARALAPLPRLLELAYPLSQAGALCLFHKGRDAERELAEAARSWTMSVTHHPSLIDPSGVILAIRDLRRADP